jgi:GTP cyclohydrolase I
VNATSTAPCITPVTWLRPVSDWLQEHLQPRGVGLVVEAEHLCMSLRGVSKPGVTTVTSALHGLVRTDPRTRDGSLALTRSGR